MRRVFSLGLIACIAAAPVRAQPEPERPALRRGADPNDWEAYFDEGTRNFDRFPDRAADSFYWDDTGRTEKAAWALRAYLDDAPRRQTQEIRIATERLAALPTGG